MTTRQPSIVDVAERAGVSVASASRVMSRSSYPVSEITRQKVLLAAAELNYEPNSLARSLKSQRSRLIGVIVGDNADPYFARVARGVEDVANERGYLTIICNTDRNPTKELKYLQTLQDYRADGVLFAGGGLSDIGYQEQVQAIVQKIIRRGAAVVTLAQHTLQTPSVQADNFGGARAITSRLIQLGHRRIAFVAGPSNLTVATIRMQGYMVALTEASLSVDPNLLISGDFSQASGKEAARILMRLSPAQRPSAVFAANDEMAIGLIIGLRLQGGRVPEDISVCGFGDVPMAEAIVPPLTTVHIPLYDLGRAGALTLLDILKHKPVPECKVLETTVVERNSTSPLVQTLSDSARPV